MSDDKKQILDLTDGTLASSAASFGTMQSEPSFQLAEPTAVLGTGQQDQGFLDLSTTDSSAGGFELATSADHAFLAPEAENHTIMGDNGDIELLGASGNIGSDRSYYKIFAAVIALCVISTASYFAYEHFAGSDQAPIVKTETNNSSKKSKSNETEVIAEAEEAKVDSIEEEIGSSITEVSDNSNYNTLENLYASIPNTYINDKGNMGEFWSKRAQKKLIKGLTHRFIFKRLQTIRMIRAARKRGADTLLRDFLITDQKFWLKFEAAQTLVEFGEVLSRSEIQNLFGNTRQPLVSRYFTRFHEAHDNSTAYLLRYAIPYVSGSARKNALVALLNQPHSYDNKLYLTAALNDPSEQISNWVNVQHSKGKVILAKRTELAANRTNIVDNPTTSGYTVAKEYDGIASASDYDLENESSESQEMDLIEVESMSERWENDLEKANDSIPEIKEIEFF